MHFQSDLWRESTDKNNTRLHNYLGMSEWNDRFVCQQPSWISSSADRTALISWSHRAQDSLTLRCSSPANMRSPRTSSKYFQSGLNEMGCFQKYSPPEGESEGMRWSAQKKERERACLQFPAYAALNTSHASASLRQCTAPIPSQVHARRTRNGRSAAVCM